MKQSTSNDLASTPDPRLEIWIFFLLVALIGLSSGCTTTPSHHSNAACCSSHNDVASTPFPDKSIYQLDSTWTNDVGRTLQLAALSGRIQIVAMFFSSCQYACPAIVHDMKRMENALPKELRGRVGFTLVTFDTERDTQEALKVYRKRQELTPERWTLLRASPADTLELAAVLGIQFKREANGQYAHSNLITILNSQGEIVHRQVGLNQDIAVAMQRIEEAGRSQTP